MKFVGESNLHVGNNAENSDPQTELPLKKTAHKVCNLISDVNFLFIWVSPYQIFAAVFSTIDHCMCLKFIYNLCLEMPYDGIYKSLYSHVNIAGVLLVNSSTQTSCFTCAMLLKPFRFLILSIFVFF